MATRNDVTGQEIKSRSNTKQFEDNWDAIFGKKKEAPVEDAKPEAEKPE